MAQRDSRRNGVFTPPILVRAVQTCPACPSQWDAWDAEGRYWHAGFELLNEESTR